MSKWKVLDAESPTRSAGPVAKIRAANKDGSGGAYLYFNAKASVILEEYIGSKNFSVAVSVDHDIAFVLGKEKAKLKVSYYNSFAIVRCKVLVDMYEVGAKFDVAIPEGKNYILLSKVDD